MGVLEKSHQHSASRAKAPSEIGFSALIAGAALLVIWLETTVGNPSLRLYFSAAAAVIAGSGAYVQTRRARPRSKDAPRARLAWRFLGILGLAVAASAAARIIHQIASPGLDPTAFPMPEDAAVLVAYPLMAAGLLAFPSHPLNQSERRELFLDGAAIFTTLLLASCFFCLNKILTAYPDAWPAQAVAIGRLGFALILLCVQMVVGFRKTSAPYAGFVRLLAPGTVVLFAAPFLATAFRSGGVRPPTEIVWAEWALICGFAGLAAARSIHADPEELKTAPADMRRVRLHLPLFSTAVVGSLIAAFYLNEENFASNLPLALVLMFLLMALIVVRQNATATETSHLAEAMREARDAAEKANNTKLQFLANISHDLRTPLNGVLGCAQILRRDISLNTKQQELVKTMQGCAEHLRNLINDLLDMSKLEVDRLELLNNPFSLRAFLDALIKTFHLEAQKKNLGLEIEIIEPLPDWVKGDQKRVHQVLGNLVHNAIKFTERGRVKLSVHGEPEGLRIEVADTGCGIMPDKIAEIFRPFHVLDERSLVKDGTGLGLSISKKLAQKMGGDIEVASIVGKGTTFIARLPLETCAPVVESKKTIVDYHGRRRRVLIVDDQAANRIVLRALLEPLNFLIEEADSAARAIESLRFARADIVLMDLMMPEIDGFGAMELIQKAHFNPPIPVFAVSAFDEEAVQKRCEEAGFRQLLSKPVSLETLLEAMGRYADIEWIYGALFPPPDIRKKASDAPIIVPPQEELAVFLELARGGYVRRLEAHAVQLAKTSPKHAAFAKRIETMTNAFQIQQIADWVIELQKN